MNCIEMSGKGKQLIIGGTYYSAISTKKSPVALVDCSGEMQVLSIVDLPSKAENAGCSVVRGISKKDYFLACTSEFIFMLQITKNDDDELNLDIALKIPHCHPGSLE